MVKLLGDGDGLVLGWPRAAQTGTLRAGRWWAGRRGQGITGKDSESKVKGRTGIIMFHAYWTRWGWLAGAHVAQRSPLQAVRGADGGLDARVLEIVSRLKIPISLLQSFLARRFGGTRTLSNFFALEFSILGRKKGRGEFNSQLCIQCEQAQIK
jgi:hypothetical protein